MRCRRRKSRAKRWQKKIRNSRWRTTKRKQLAHGWLEICLNTLVPAGAEITPVEDPGFTPMTVIPCTGCEEYAHVHNK